MKLGIVGHGFVGSAINQGFTKDVKKYIVDPKYFSSNTIKELIAFKPDATFVAVPTPQLESGECNTEILESVMQQLNELKNHLVIIKSTVPSYKIEAIQEQCINLKIVYNPEFLAEKNYIEEDVKEYMKWNSINIEVNLNIGSASYEVYTCDFTHDYIDINTDYRN